MNEREFLLQLKAIEQLHETLLIAVKFTHSLWDESLDFDDDIRQILMNLYGVLTGECFMPIHQVYRNLLLEAEVMYDIEVVYDDEGGDDDDQTNP